MIGKQGQRRQVGEDRMTKEKENEKEVNLKKLYTGS